MPKIKVSDKALAHLSRGLYRSPASALKELVSNAWDANAHQVTITTNYPTFLQVACVDDGDGFTRQDFEQLMQGGIGNSDKREHPKKLIHGRPLLGRLGIGLLSMAQICGAFRVSSRPRRGGGFSARIILYDLLREKLDKNAEGVVEAGEKVEEVYVGSYEFEEVNTGKLPYGTSIVADDVHPAFARAFENSVKRKGFVEPDLTWKKAARQFYEVSSIRELGDYWKLLWELSVACPIPYLSADVLPEHVVRREHERLEKYDFKLIVDNIALRKPVHLKGNIHGYTVVKFPRQSKRVYGKPLIFGGYLVVQEGKELMPAELRGIVVRIKNVAIGYYDGTLLDYGINEGPRSRWVTGEVFISDGLENALNIDRDSFNQFHPEFRALQEFVHEQARRLFSKTYKKIEIRSEERAANKEIGHEKVLKSVLQDCLGKTVVFKEIPITEGQDAAGLVAIKKYREKIRIQVPKKTDIKVKRSNRDLARAIFVLYEIAMLKTTRSKERGRMFPKLMIDLLRRW